LGLCEIGIGRAVLQIAGEIANKAREFGQQAARFVRGFAKATTDYEIRGKKVVVRLNEGPRSNIETK